MPLTVQELQNLANVSLDHYMRGDPIEQFVQDKPLYAKMRGMQKTFPGGKEFIRGNVKGDYTTEFMGFSHDDEVAYGNPANVKQFSIPWKELHAGISFDMTEMKKAGISIVPDTSGEREIRATPDEGERISDLLDDKMNDMAEGMAISFDSILHLDGTQDAKVFAGLSYFVSDTPTTGTYAGISRADNAWWRNRSLVGASKIVSSVSSQTLTKTLRSEVRQLRRYGGKPNLILCGSTFLDKLEAEIHEKGTYTQTGFVNNGKNDIGMAAISMRGVGDFLYDPTLDDTDREDYAYFLDTRHIFPMVMKNEDMKRHSPERPAEKYVVYRAVTWTGALVANKLNAHGVYQTS